MSSRRRREPGRAEVQLTSTAMLVGVGHHVEHDRALLRLWLSHPSLQTTELRLTSTLATVVGRRIALPQNAHGVSRNSAMVAAANTLPDLSSTS